MQDNQIDVKIQTDKLEDSDTDFDDSDFVDAIQRKKKRVKRRIEKCFVCLERIEQKDLFRPCNCEFSPIHLDCLKRWMEEGRTKCRICGQFYDILNAPNTCGICRKFLDDDDYIRSCSCYFRKYHRQCVQNNIDNNNTQCLYCGINFATSERVSYQLTSKYLQKALTCIIKGLTLAAKILYVIFWLTIAAFLVAPENIIQNHWNVLDCPTGFVLFPGNLQVPLWFDIVYLIITTFVYLFLYIYSINWEPMNKSYWILTPALLFTIMIHQLLGNFHYQFYCATSTIPSINCRWMLTINSFFAGTTFSYPPLLLCLIFSCVRKICCKKVITKTVVNLEERAQT